MKKAVLIGLLVIIGFLIGMFLFQKFALAKGDKPPKEEVACYQMNAHKCMEKEFDGDKCPRGWDDKKCKDDEEITCYRIVEDICEDKTEWNHCDKGWKEGKCEIITPPTCEELGNCPVDEPAPPVYSGVSDGRSPQASAPQCTNPDTRSKPANVHVVRVPGSTKAEVKWFQTEGDQANIYYQETFSKGWKHSVRDIEVKGKFGDVVVGELHSDRDYIFGVQQKFGCAGGEVTSAVVINK